MDPLMVVVPLTMVDAPPTNAFPDVLLMDPRVESEPLTSRLFEIRVEPPITAILLVVSAAVT
jgi:hypothetical protein